MTLTAMRFLGIAAAHLHRCVMRSITSRSDEQVLRIKTAMHVAAMYDLQFRIEVKFHPKERRQAMNQVVLVLIRDLLVPVRPQWSVVQPTPSLRV